MSRLVTCWLVVELPFLDSLTNQRQVLDVQKRGGSYDQAADFWGLGAVLFVS